MSILLLLIVLVVLVAVAGGMAFLTGANAVGRNAKKSLQVVKGVELDVPETWYGSHEPEAKLHRRLQAAAASLRDATANEIVLANAVTQAEHHAIRIDQKLIACSKLPASTKGEYLAELEQAVETFETLVTGVVTSAGPSIDTVTEDLQHLASELTALEQARAEVERIDRPEAGT